MSTPSAPSHFAVDVPAPALAVGLTLQTLGPAVKLGSTWFDHNFYRLPIAGQSVQNPDGSVSLPIGGNGYGICTARQIDAKTGTWAGSAYKPPFYVEATLSFVPSIAPGSSHPSFWANPIEGMSTVNAPASGDQWVGQAPWYLDSVELDFFEQGLWGMTGFGTGMHNWYGTRGGGLQVHTSQPTVSIAPRTFDQQNRYGFRIIPATATTSGEARWYFNGVQVGLAKTWVLYDPALLPPPVDGTSAFSIADVKHYSPIINTCDVSPMTVHSMEVWQASAAGNLIQ